MSENLPYVRCITCGKVLANLWKEYEQMLEDGVKISDALDRLGVTRSCCRVRLMNPVKVVPRSVQTQEDVDAMTVSKARKITTTKSVVVPEEEEISLPELQELPEIPTIPKTKRIYKAW